MVYDLLSACQNWVGALTQTQLAVEVLTEFHSEKTFRVQCSVGLCAAVFNDV